MKRISIDVISADKMRYASAGDWRFEDNGDSLIIEVADLEDWRYNMLVAVHELVEVLICNHTGVTQEEVDQFDMQYEKDRKEGDDSEPGDNSKAPYREEHCLSCGVERILAAVLNVEWNLYEDAIEALKFPQCHS